MAQQTPADRIREHYGKRMFMHLLILVGYYAIASGLLWNIGDGDMNRLKSFADNILTEVGGAVITLYLFQLFLERHDRERDMLRALRQMESFVHVTAIDGVNEITAGGFLRDGSLRGAILTGANLQGALMLKANLQGVDMWHVNLQNANLWHANLQVAHMLGANLRGADLRGANLQGADLTSANLQGAQLYSANLEAADLVNADLQGADLRKATFDDKTKLPDFRQHKQSFWTPDTDMTRFTDPNYPEFWRSDNPRSPAYRSNA